MTRGLRPSDVGPAALIAALAAFVLAGTWELTVWDGFTPGPGFFPRIIGAVGLVLALAELAARLRTGRAEGAEPLEPGAGRRIGLTIAGLAAVALLAPALGMSVAVGAFMLFMLVAALRRRLLPSVATAVGVAVGLELLFVRWLGVPLPPPFFA